MIWDFFSRGQEPSFYETAYGPLGYARRYDGVEMVRMPVEADVEYLFVEGVYFAWKSTADDAWMARQLDAAVRAMDYSFTDRARFSTKYGLVKRGYTIDTWDFQIDDATTRIFPRWGTLLVDPDRSKFGVMFGDNTGYAASCGYLAEMLERAGRPQEAARFRAAREGRARAARPRGLARHALPPLGPGGRDDRARRRRRRARAGLALEHVLAQPWDHATSRRRRSSARTRRSAASLPPGSPGRVVRDLPAVREGLRRPLRAVAVRERRRLADLRRRAGARGLRPRLRGLRGRRPLARPRPLEVERRPDLVRLHRGLPARRRSRASRRSTSRSYANMDLGGTGRARRAALDGGDARRSPRPPADGPADVRRRAVPRGRSRRERPARRGRRLAPPRLPRARGGPGRRDGRLDLPPPQRRQRGQPEDRRRDHASSTRTAPTPRSTSSRTATSPAGGTRRSRARGRGATAPPRHPPAREARLARQERRLPERRYLLVRPRQPAPGPERIRSVAFIEHARRRDLRRRRA